MPSHVRNFWIDVDVDGRQTKIATGPRHDDGGLSIRLKQRTEKSGIIDVIAVNCIRRYGGILRTSVVLDADAAKYITTSGNFDPTGNNVQEPGTIFSFESYQDEVSPNLTRQLAAKKRNMPENPRLALCSAQEKLAALKRDMRHLPRDVCQMLLNELLAETL